MIINLTKNCEKSQLARKIVRLAIFHNTRKIAIFAAAKKRTHFVILGVANIASEAAFLIIGLLFMSPFKSQETRNVN